MDVFLAVPLLACLFYAADGKFPDPMLFAQVVDSSFKDITGKNADPLIGPDVTFTTGPYGNSNGALLSNGGSGAYARWENLPGSGGPLDFRTEYTILFWVKNTGTGLGCIFCYKTDTNLVGWEIWEWNAENQLFIRDAHGDPVNLYSVQYSSAFKTNETPNFGADFRSDYPYVKMFERNAADEEFEGAVACLQLYNTYMTYREISQATTLCQPESASLKPWPRALGVWPLTEYYGTLDMALDGTSNDATAINGFLNYGPSGGLSKTSYQFVSTRTSYLEIDNSDKSLSPSNSLTLSMWIYPTTSTVSFPIFQYEHGAEVTGSNSYAFHIWAITGLFIRPNQNDPSRNYGSITPLKWNFIAFSYDYSSDTGYWLVDGHTYQDTFGNPKPDIATSMADRITIGQSLYALETRRMDAKISCVQIFDTWMSYDEMKQLSNTCDDMLRSEQGVPSSLVVMYSFNTGSRCVGRGPSGERYELMSSTTCTLCQGHRMREEALRISMSSITGDRATFKYTDVNSADEERLKSASPFTFMAYMKLSSTNVEASVKLGPARVDGAPSNTWWELSTNGTLRLSISNLNEADTHVTAFTDFYNHEWIHIAIACHVVSSRCYVFRKGEVIGESIESMDVDWFISDSLSAEIISGDTNTNFDISCMQLYSRALSQGEVITARDRCYLKGSTATPPLPVGFWPLDYVYRTRELTGRSNDLVISSGVTFDNDSPFSSNLGSIYFNTKGQYATVAASTDTDTRYSMTFQAYLKIISNDHAPIFTYENGPTEWGVVLFIVERSGIPKFRHRLFSPDAVALYGGYETEIARNTWQRVAMTFDYYTGLVKTYIEGHLVHVLKANLMPVNTQPVVKIGTCTGYSGAVFKLSCVQIYDKALTANQLDMAADLCSQAGGDSSHYRMPWSLPSGFTQKTVYRSAVVRNQLSCLQLCSADVPCLAINYDNSSATCSLSSLTYSQTGIDSFESTGGAYLEKIHPLIAQAL